MCGAGLTATAAARSVGPAAIIAAKYKNILFITKGFALTLLA